MQIIFMDGLCLNSYCMDDLYSFEVDLEYPNHLHDLYDEYLLAPEPLLIKDNMLSQFAKDM